MGSGEFGKRGSSKKSKKQWEKIKARQISRASKKETSCPHLVINKRNVIFANETVHLEKRCGACNKHLGYAKRPPIQENNFMTVFSKKREIAINQNKMDLE